MDLENVLSTFEPYWAPLIFPTGPIKDCIPRLEDLSVVLEHLVSIFFRILRILLNTSMVQYQSQQAEPFLLF